MTQQQDDNVITVVMEVVVMMLMMLLFVVLLLAKLPREVVQRWCSEYRKTSVMKGRLKMRCDEDESDRTVELS